MRNLLWQSDAWKEYESLQAEKLILKKVNISLNRESPQVKSHMKKMMTLLKIISFL